MPAPNRIVATRTFTETTGAGTYKASVRVPANAVLRSVRYNNRVAWDASTSAGLVIGTTDGGNELLTTTNLKSGISITEVADSDLDTAQPTPTTSVTVYATVTTVGASGSAGRGVLEVEYDRLPDASLATPNPIAAVKS
jgi:hypothetical protein